MVCQNCGEQFENKRKDAKYCSDSCRVSGNKKKNLGDQVVNQVPFTMSYPTYPIYYHPSPTPNRVLTPQTFNSLRDTVDRVNSSDDITAFIVTAATALLGGSIAYFTSDEKTFAKKLGDTAIGFGFGGMLGGLIATGVKLYNRENRESRLNESMSPTQFGLNDDYTGRMVTAESLQMMNIPSVDTSKAWFSSWLGNSFNQRFSIVLSGAPGSGKSHLLTLLLNPFTAVGKVLLVLSEEGISNHVKERIAKYNLKNVDILDTKEPLDIIERLKTGDYKVLALDSLQGLRMNLHQQVGFMRAIKKFNLLGSFVISQVSKEGSMRGKMELQHECDVMIEVTEGVATTTKNRFSETGRQFGIFQKVQEQKVVPLRTAV